MAVGRALLNEPLWALKIHTGQACLKEFLRSTLAELF